MDASDIRGLDELGNLIEAARCLGLVQSRKAFGQYGADDAASEHGLHASISERSARLRAEVEALRAAPQQAEPVAWMKPTRDSCYLRSAETMLAIHEDCDGIVRTGWKPLYLHPPAAEVQRLRDALTALLDHYVSLVASGDAGKWDAEQEPQVIAARRALGGE